MTHHVVTWVWGNKYPQLYVDRLRRGIERHFPDARFIVASPPEEDRHLTLIPGCFARLRVFSPDWQEAHGIAEGDTIVALDLDMVVTGDLTKLFNRDVPFAILQNVNTSNPGKYNGSVWQLRAGYRPDIWHDFTIEKASALPCWEFPSDQGYFEHMIPGAPAFGPETGVYGFCKKGWPPGADLPRNAKLVAFFGWRDPSKFTHIDWVKRNWV